LLRYRFLIIATALVPLLTVAVVGLWLEPMSHLTLTGAATAGVLFSIWLILFGSRNYMELMQVAGQLQESLRQDQETNNALVVPLNGLQERVGDDPLVVLLAEYGTRLSKRREQLREGMKAVMEVFCQLADVKRPIPSLTEFTLPDSADETLMQGSYYELSKAVLKLRRRAKTFARFLAEFPLPIIVTDKQYRILSVNLAGEGMLGRLTKNLYRRSLLKLFVDPTRLDHDTQAPALGPEDVIVELMCGKTVEAVAALRGANEAVIRVAVRAKFGHCHIFSFRELDNGAQVASTTESNLAIKPLVSIHS
jgi:PAS domain-containing protein